MPHGLTKHNKIIANNLLTQQYTANKKHNKIIANNLLLQQ